MKTRGTYRLGLMALVTVLLELLIWLVMLGLGWLLVTKVPAFRFDKPWMLWGMLGGPLLVVVFLLHVGWRNRALARFAAPATLPRMVQSVSSGRMLARFLLLRHGLALVVLALAGPQFGTRYEEVKAEGVDVVVAIDVSNSMACEDLKPNRMEAARRAMAQLIDRLQGDRLGIVVFAGEAYVQLPITADRSAAKLFLASVNIGTVATQGTAIGAAIDMARRSFGEEGAGSRVIIVITDGENHEDDAMDAARRAAQEGIIVHTVGMGTPQGGPIPVRQGGRLMGFRKDRNGNTVVTRLDEDMLRGIADAGNGTFVRGDQGSNAVVQLVEDLRNLDRSELGTYRYAAHEDQFQYPLGLGLLLLLSALAFSDRGGRNRARLAGRPLAVVAMLVLLSACGAATTCVNGPCGRATRSMTRVHTPKRRRSMQRPRTIPPHCTTWAMPCTGPPSGRRPSRGSPQRPRYWRQREHPWCPPPTPCTTWAPPAWPRPAMRTACTRTTATCWARSASRVMTCSARWSCTCFAIPCGANGSATAPSSTRRCWRPKKTSAKP